MEPSRSSETRLPWMERECVLAAAWCWGSPIWETPEALFLVGGAKLVHPEPWRMLGSPALISDSGGHLAVPAMPELSCGGTGIALEAGGRLEVPTTGASCRFGCPEAGWMLGGPPMLSEDKG